MGSARGKLGGLLLRPSVQRLREEIDPEGPGGAYMLGLRKVGVVAHGRFTRRGFARAIEVAAHAVQEDVIGRTRTALQDAGALRAAGGDGAPGDSGGSSDPVATVPGQ
jgi:glycerol-3-phosphate acyltransferase PlsX